MQVCRAFLTRPLAPLAGVGYTYVPVVSYPCGGKHGDVNVLYQGILANDYLKLFSMNVTNTLFADSIFDLHLCLSDCISGSVTLAEIKAFEARR